MFKTGLLGRSILASRSPWLHEQEAAAQGMALRYELFDFTDRGWPDSELGPLLQRLREQGYAGVNVTYPFKQAVMPLLDDLGDCAAMVGAVNTVAMSDGRLKGFNTDKTGFQDALAQDLPDVRMDRVLQLGAGGAGAAVATALRDAGVRQVVLHDLDAGRVKALVRQLVDRFGAGAALPGTPEGSSALVDGIVNTTPVGMQGKPGMPIPAAISSPRHWVADIVYFPLETELLRVAREKGCRTLDGSGMVVNQAALAFEKFTGRTADRARMRKSFYEAAAH